MEKGRQRLLFSTYLLSSSFRSLRAFPFLTLPLRHLIKVSKMKASHSLCVRSRRRRGPALLLFTLLLLLLPYHKNKGKDKRKKEEEGKALSFCFYTPLREGCVKTKRRVRNKNPLLCFSSFPLSQ